MTVGQVQVAWLMVRHLPPSLWTAGNLLLSDVLAGDEEII